ALLCGTAKRKAGNHRMGTGAIHVRRKRRRVDQEAGVRPVLREEPFASSGRSDPAQDRQSRLAGRGRALSADGVTACCTLCVLPSNGSPTVGSHTRARTRTTERRSTLGFRSIALSGVKFHLFPAPTRASVTQSRLVS